MNRNLLSDEIVKNKLFTAIVLTVLCLAFLIACTAGKADFSGTWKLNAAESESVAPGTEQMMIVKQTDDEIIVAITDKTSQGEHKTQDNYTVSGKPIEITQDTPNGNKQKIKRTSVWTEKGFEVVEEVLLDTSDGGTTTVHIKRNWTLSADDKTLVMEMDVDTPAGKKFLKRTYAKV